MKQLFIAAFALAAFYTCLAVPLRLQKRAAFYIANETACVVDNLVYSSGDPIPTDDPCEACKCRPPGFACVLKECRPKPGCRAVRHAGQCCPEYVCGCEHNGKMYADGDEIRDAKNPCYVCHCQGSSIACAFADCLFRADCPPVYVPGECCPEYTNCTRRDAAENTQPKDNNPVPSLNLLPGLNYESVIETVKTTTTPKAVSPTEIATQSSVATERSALDVKISSDFQTEATSAASSENKMTSVTAEKETEKEGEIVIHSETGIKKDEGVEVTTLKIPSLEDQEIKTASEEPENQSESVSSVSEILDTEKTVKNSAANNSKSLKLADDKSVPTSEKSEDVKTEMPVTVDIETTEAPPSTESSSNIDSTTKSEPETAAEEIQSSHHSHGDKIKSETSETVTIVVHVKDKTTTEASKEHAATDSGTNTTPESLLNSKDELKSSESAKTTLAEVRATEPGEKTAPLAEKPKDFETPDSTSEAPQTTVSNYETSSSDIGEEKHVTQSIPAEARAEENETKKETADDLKTPSSSIPTVSEMDSKTDKAEENQGTTAEGERGAESRESGDEKEKTSTEEAATTRAENKTEAESKEISPKSTETAANLPEHTKGLTTELSIQDVKPSAQTERPTTISE